MDAATQHDLIVGILQIFGLFIGGFFTVRAADRQAKNSIAAEKKTRETQTKKEREEQQQRESERERLFNQSLETFQKAYIEVSSKLNARELELDTLRDKLFVQSAELSGMRANQKDSLDKISSLEQKLTQYQRENEDFRVKLEQAHRDLKLARAERSSAVNDLEAKSRELVEANEDRARLEERLQKQTEEMATIRDELDETKRRLSLLEKKDTEKLNPADVPDHPPVKPPESSA